MERSRKTERDRGDRPAANIPVPLSVPPDIAEQLSGFSGREWVFTRLDDWCRAGERGLFVVGGPGSGKSWLIAELIRRHWDSDGSYAAAALAGWHFCRSSNDSTLLPHYVVGGLATQLSSLPGYLDALAATEPVVAATIQPTVNVHGDVAAGAQVIAAQVTLVDASVERQFDRVVRGPLNTLAQQGRLPDRLVLAVDGLDEALVLPDGELLVALLSRLLSSADSLPPGVLLLLTGRPDRRLITRIPVAQVNLDDPESNTDIETYARRRIDTRLPGDRAQQFAQQVTAGSKGSFLYARYVLDDLLADPSSFIVIPNRLPDGLSGYYQASLDRELAARAEGWEQRYRPLLGALAVARSGLTSAQLSAITGMQRSAVDDALKRCSPYLTGSGNEPIRLFHQSFADYLVEDGRHTIFPDEAHHAVATYLATVSDAEQIDLIWHLAKAGDLRALDVALRPERLAQRELLFGSVVVVNDLLAAADGAATPGDIIRTLRWTWAAAERRRHGAEAVNPQLIALVSRLGHIDEAIRAATLLDPDQPRYTDVVTALGEQLVDLGRVNDALAFVLRARLPFGTAGVLARIATKIAATDPHRALGIIAEYDVAASPELCSALARAGEEFLPTAEQLAGSDPDVLSVVVKVVGQYDVERAVEISKRIQKRYEPAAGSKQVRGPGTPLSELIAQVARTDPLKARTLLDRFLESNLLESTDKRVAIAALGLAWAPEQGVEALSLLHYVSDGVLDEVTRGLVLAATATASDPAARRAAIERWRGTTLCWWSHRRDIDILDRLDLIGLGATHEARIIAGELFTHVVERVAQDSEPLEYPDTAAAALAAAVATVDTERCIAVVDRVLPSQGPALVAEAKRRLAIELARIDPRRANDVALSAGGYYSHLALVGIVDTLAATNLAEALEVIDRVDVRYTGTRAELLGTAAAHVPVGDVAALEQLRSRLPRRGDSEAFAIPYAAAGMELAAAAIDHDQALVQALLDRCSPGIAYDESVRDPLTIAECVRLCAADPVRALDRVSSVSRPLARVEGTIKVLETGRYDDAVTTAVIVKALDQARFSRIDKRTEGDLVELILDLARRDFDRGLALALELKHRTFTVVAPLLVSLEIERLGPSAAVQRILSAVLVAPTPPQALSQWAQHHRLVALFDEQPAEVGQLLMDELDRLEETGLRDSLEPWHLASSDPWRAHALVRKQNLHGPADDEVLQRAARQDLGIALSLSEAGAGVPTAQADDPILGAVAAAARADPRMCRQVIVNFSWADEYTRSSVFRAAVAPAASGDPSIALDLLRRITDDRLRGYALEEFVSTPIVAANRGHADWGVRPLMAMTEMLSTERRRDVLAAIATEMATGNGVSASEICQTLTKAAQRDTQTYERCLPRLLTAAYNATLVSGHDLLGEFDVVATLVRA